MLNARFLWKMMNKDALLSPCGTYRYLLQRSWDASREAVCFVMLNPSTADADIDDPTIRKCIGFAQRLGYGQLEVVNLFAYRSTDPDKLRTVSDPVGPENDDVIAGSIAVCHTIICGWGTKSPPRLTRAPYVLNLIHKMGKIPMALKLTKGGHPQHPLYLPYEAQPQGIPE